MITIQSAHEVATHHGWLSQTPAVFRRAVLEKTHLQEASAGEAIYSVGDQAGGMYCLVSGALRVHIATAENGPCIAHLLRPGTWTGQGPAITGQPRLIGLSAARQSSLLHLPLSAIRQISTQDPECWRYIAALTFSHLGIALGVMDDLMIRDHVDRFIATLLRLGGCRTQTPPELCPINVDLSQEELATMANVARTTAGAILRKLEAKRLVEISYGRIVVLEPDELRAMLVK